LTEPDVRFKKWAEKLTKALKADAVGQLPDGCRWLSYWLRKVRDQDLYLFQKLEKEAQPLFEDSALRLHKEATSKLDKASRHRVGSKAKLKEIVSFAYDYSHYIHPLLRESGRHSLAKETLMKFNSQYLSEMIQEGEKLEGDWPVFMIRLLECSEEMGIQNLESTKDYFIEVLRGRKTQPELFPYLRVLDELKRSNHSRMVSGLILSTALRMWVRDLCIYYGAESRSSFIGPREGFESWSFAEMLGYLKSVGRASLDEVIIFTAMNRDLFEMVGKEGYREPDNYELEEDIQEAQLFISFRDGEITSPDADGGK
jgi:hypothetical protein